jgi:hypothetical protein
MKKRIFYMISIFVTTSLILYLSGCIANNSFKLYDWTDLSREISALVFGGINLVADLILLFIDLEN